MYALLAQLVERPICNREVTGSTPVLGTKTHSIDLRVSPQKTRTCFHGVFVPGKKGHTHVNVKTPYLG